MTRRPWRRLVPQILYPAIVFVLVVGGWEAGARTGLFPAYVLPGPLTILQRAAGNVDLMLWHCWVTSSEIVTGFVLALVIGVLLAAAIVFVRPIEQALYPWLVVVQVVPKVAIGPLLVVWLGIGFMPKILISFLLAFFPVVIDTMIGLKSVHPDSIRLLRSMGAGPAKRFLHLQLPHALPHIFGAMKVAITLATVGAIVGEFVGADNGLGYVLIVATGSLDAPLMFVALLWITVIALLFYGAIAVLEKKCLGWHVSVRNHSLPGA